LGYFPIARTPATSASVAGVSGHKVQIGVIVEEPYWDFGELAVVVFFDETGHQGRVRQEPTAGVPLHGGNDEVI